MEPELKQLLLKDGLVLGPEIGKGSFGTVYRCTDVKTQISYAVKKIDLRVLRMQPQFVLERLKRECSVLENLSHPCVVRLYKTIEAPDAILMVMEMVLGMELFEMIVAVSGLGESEACAIFIQIASALAYMHKRGVVHRDIKPENILIQGSTGEDISSQQVFHDAFRHLRPRIKLIDFGLSKVLGSDHGGSLAKSLVGTPRYVAPEIVAIGERMRHNRELDLSRSKTEQVSYTEMVDCYSAGVLLHVMVSACFPQFKNADEVIFVDPRIAKVSDDCKDLISRLMVAAPDKRLTMADALRHPWVTQHQPRAAEAALRIAGIMTSQVARSPRPGAVQTAPRTPPAAPDLGRHSVPFPSLGELNDQSPLAATNRSPMYAENVRVLESEDSIMDEGDAEAHQASPIVQNLGAGRFKPKTASKNPNPSLTMGPQDGTQASPSSAASGSRLPPSPRVRTAGLKRQISQQQQTDEDDFGVDPDTGDAHQEDLDADADPQGESTSASGKVGAPARGRFHSVSSQKSNSRSSIEILNLPGAGQGVWGPYSGSGENDPERLGSGSTEGSGADVFSAMTNEQSELQRHLDRSEKTHSTQEHGPSRGRGRGARDQARKSRNQDALVPRQTVGGQASHMDPLSSYSTSDNGLVNPDLLLQLQTKIAQCFRKSFDAFKEDDVVSPGIVSSAVASRELLGASETILKKLEQTSISVLDLLPDMQIAVEEGEFGMAISCFDTIKDWIRTIQRESQDLLKANVKVIAAVNNTLQLARRRQRVKDATEAGFRVSDALALEEDMGFGVSKHGSMISTATGASGGAIEAAQAGERESTAALKRAELREVEEEQRQGSFNEDNHVFNLESRERLAARRRESMHRANQQENHITKQLDQDSEETAMVPSKRNTNYLVVKEDDEEYELEPISHALAMLQQIDRLLQKHASFWSHMEVVVDVLMQRANHVESMVNFTKNPRLRGRFLERVQEYSTMWDRITQMCQQFNHNANHLEGGKLYQFLTEV